MKKFLITLVTITALVTVLSIDTSACPKCNADFRQELMDKRANSLGGQELLEAIKNQDGGNSVVLPVKYIKNDAAVIEENKEMVTDIKAEDNSIGAFDLVKIFITIWFIRS